MQKYVLERHGIHTVSVIRCFEKKAYAALSTLEKTEGAITNQHRRLKYEQHGPHWKNNGTGVNPGKQFMFLLRHPPYCSYIPVKFLFVIEETWQEVTQRWVCVQQISGQMMYYLYIYISPHE